MAMYEIYILLSRLDWCPYLQLFDKLQKEICKTAGPSLATSLESFTQHQNEASLSLFLKAVTYPEFFWVDRLLLGIPTSPFCHHGWRKFLHLVLPDALKMHSLAVPVLRFLCKTFSKLRKLNNETLFSMDV